MMCILWRVLLTFGPLVAVSAGFVALGEFATEFAGPSRLPDLGLLRGAASPFEARVGYAPAYGSDDDDVIVIAHDDGLMTVTTNGWSRVYAMDGDRRLVVFGRGGDDEIRVEAGITGGLIIDGGEGDDVITGAAGDDVLRGGTGDDVIVGRAGDDLVDAGPGADTVSLGPGRDGVDGGGGGDRLAGGAGHDYLQGGLGRDTLLGQAGDDVLYGLDGRDLLVGGDGADYLDGGAGDDALTGQDGRDLVFGGVGDDRLEDAFGGDLLAGGEGRDDYAAGPRSRVITDAYTGDIRGLRVVDDRYGFSMRVTSDLEVLRSIPLGRELLAALAASGQTVEIFPTAAGNSTSFAVIADGFVRTDGTPGPGTGGRVHYNPFRTAVGDAERDWMRRPPIVGLIHELAHALNGTYGTLVTDEDARQRQAIGDGEQGDAAAGGAVAASGDRRTFDENAFRAFFGLPLRE